MGNNVTIQVKVCDDCADAKEQNWTIAAKRDIKSARRVQEFVLADTPPLDTIQIVQEASPSAVMDLMEVELFGGRMNLICMLTTFKMNNTFYFEFDTILLKLTCCLDRIPFINLAERFHSGPLIFRALYPYVV